MPKYLKYANIPHIILFQRIRKMLPILNSDAVSIVMYKIVLLPAIPQIPETNQQRHHGRQGWRKAHKEQRRTAYPTETVRQWDTEEKSRYQTVNHRE